MDREGNAQTYLDTHDVFKLLVIYLLIYIHVFPYIFHCAFNLI